MILPCDLSLVVTSRNDDHGKNMLRRFNMFAEALLKQAERHGLRGELIVVEWNPPAGRRLHEVLDLKVKSEEFTIRFIDVPFAAHASFRNSDVIPLFQMIAKNVGIRRARGKFVLATNPDLIFSDALVSFLASGKLDPKTMYRIDRHDVPSQPPDRAPLDEQLAWCDAHVLRVHRKWGSFPPTSKWRRLFQGLSAKTFGSTLRKHFETKFDRLVALGGKFISCWKNRGNYFHRFSWRNALRRARWFSFHELIFASLRRGLRVMRSWAWTQTSRSRYALYWPLRMTRSFLWIGVHYLDSLPKVHTNGCGDFTLLSRESWFALRGYPELPLWSMHLDSLLCYMAVASGLREEVLRPPAKMFHLEHENSWVVLSPEARLKTFALKPWIDIGLLSELWSTMYLRRHPVEFNADDWGLAQWSFDEVIVQAGKKSLVKHQAPTALAGTG